jgi:radical SAM modification target selenobiotic family peptide
MDRQDLKKLLAGFSIVTLLTGTAIMGCATPAKSS